MWDYLTWVHAQDRCQEDDEENLHFGMAFLVLNTGCFLMGYFIYCERQRLCMPRRLPREGTWARLYAGPREGLLCGGDICFRCLSYLTVTCLATKAPLHFYTLAFPPTLGQSVHEWKKKKNNTNSLEQVGLMHLPGASKTVVAPCEQSSPPPLLSCVELLFLIKRKMFCFAFVLLFF